MQVLHCAVAWCLVVVQQRTRGAGYTEQTVLEPLVGEVAVALRVHDAHSVDDEAVRIEVGCGGTQGDAPQSVGIALHGMASGKLHIDEHLAGLVVFVAEGHGAVFMAHGRLIGLRPDWLHGQQEHEPKGCIGFFHTGSFHLLQGLLVVKVFTKIEKFPYSLSL